MKNAKTRLPNEPRANRGKAIKDLTQGRICTKCKIYKERDFFYEHNTGFNGLGSTCKTCLHIKSTSEESKKTKKLLYDTRKNTKNCVSCGSSNLATNVHCHKCWFGVIASSRAGGHKNLHIILDLWNEQDGKCFYTGEQLIPGNNASLDHQMPVSRGGKNIKENLKWVSLQVNIIKATKTHEEFIDFCKQIIKYNNIKLGNE